jgi:SulP family sulfate permease
VLIVRVDASLYFANAQYLENYLRRAIAERRDVNAIVLDCSAINAIDASALQILTDLIEEFSENGIEIYISELKERVIARLQRIRFCHTVGASRFFVSTHEAVQAICLDDAAVIDDTQPTAKPAFWVR